MRSEIKWDMEAKSINVFISAVLKDYVKLGDRLHAAAIMGFVHAANHGDPVALNTFFDGLRENDQNMLKAWLLKNSTYTDVVGGEEVKKQWIGYRSTDKDAKHPKGFFVKPKTEAIRKDKFTVEVMYEGDAFFDTPDKAGKPMTLAAILAALAKLDGQIEKKEEKATEESETGKVEIDADLRAMVKALSSKAEEKLKIVELAQVKFAHVQAAPERVQ